MAERSRIGKFRGAIAAGAAVVELTRMEACSSVVSSPVSSSSESRPTGTVAPGPGRLPTPLNTATIAAEGPKKISCITPTPSDRAGRRWAGHQEVELAPGAALILTSEPGNPQGMTITTPNGSKIIFGSASYIAGVESDRRLTIRLAGSGHESCEKPATPPNQDTTVMKDVSGKGSYSSRVILEISPNSVSTTTVQ